MDDNKINRIIAHTRDKKNSVEIVQEIQKEFGYIPEDVLKEVSRRVSIPLVKLYGVATFYTQFKLKPEGRFKISVCRGTACHVKNSKHLLYREENQNQIWRDKP